MLKLLYVLVFALAVSHLCAQPFDAEMVDHRTEVALKNGKLTTDYYYKIKINNRNGEDYTKVSIRTSKLIKASKVRAHIETADGTVIKKLAKNAISERSVVSGQTFYQDARLKVFSLRHTSYPYYLVYSYRTEQRQFLSLSYWWPVLNELVPTAAASLSVTVPKATKVNYRAKQVNQPQITEQEDLTTYTWKASYNGKLEQEWFAPSVYNYLPHVELVPEQFQFEVAGSQQSWQAFSDWQLQVLQGMDVLPQSELDQVERITQNINTKKEKARALYHYLQDACRYINVTIETGGLVPVPALEVAQNKYGDCKGLANYYRAMLAHVGIPSHYTLVNAGSRISDLDASFPSSQFNHAIVCVPLKDDTLWVDCTSDGPFNKPGTFIQNRPALLIGKGNACLKPIPALQMTDVLACRTMHIAAPQNQNRLAVSMYSVYRGNGFEQLLDIDKNTSGKDKKRYIQQGVLPPNFELDSFELAFPRRDSAIALLDGRATAADLYKDYGTYMLMRNIALRLPKIEKPEKRRLPLQINYPINRTDTLVYSLPKGYQLSDKTTDIVLDNAFGSYSIRFVRGDDAVRLVKSLRIAAAKYPLTEYEKFYAFYHQVYQTEHGLEFVINKTEQPTK